MQTAMFTSKPFTAPSPLTMLSRHQLEAMAKKLEQSFKSLLDDDQIDPAREATELQTVSI